MFDDLVLRFNAFKNLNLISYSSTIFVSDVKLASFYKNLLFMFKGLISFHYYNDTISSIIGIFSNILAIYIVKKRTSIVMRQYSQTLLQNCAIDLFCNIAILITKEVDF